jgi:hypothetical protein
MVICTPDIAIKWLVPVLRKTAHCASVSAWRSPIASDAALLWMPTELVIDRMRAATLARGDRVFEYGFVDQPRDVAVDGSVDVLAAGDHFQCVR